MKNRLIIAAAGSGKTTYLIKEALDVAPEKVLITTYTDNNTDEIRRKLIRKYKYIPSHITIQTWFSFLMQHGVRPYQGTFNNLLFDKQIRGMILNNDYQGTFPFKKNGKTIHIPFSEKTNFFKHYFSNSMKIYSDRLPKFVFKANKTSNNEIINRIARIYKNIFIDEVQDLAGYDLDILKLLFKSNSNIILVGDPRQVTYLTHHERMNKDYIDGKIREYVNDKCNPKLHVEIDDRKLKKSHRNNKQICDFSSLLYKNYPTVEPCGCKECRNYEVTEQGVFLVKTEDVDDYLAQFDAVQLRWDRDKQINTNYKYYNFGESKGMTFDRVIIYPTEDMKKWILNNNHNLSNGARAKFYVAITRARYSVAIIMDDMDNLKLPDIQLYYP